jgi:LAO/AO transport system kinase
MRALSKTRGHATHTAVGDGHVGAKSLPADPERWTPPIVKCVATRGEGIVDLVAGLDGHRAWGAGTEAGRARRRARLAEEVREALREALIEAAVRELAEAIDNAARDVEAHAVDPYTATERLVNEFVVARGSR